MQEEAMKQQCCCASRLLLGVMSRPTVGAAAGESVRWLVTSHLVILEQSEVTHMLSTGIISTGCQVRVQE